MKLCTLILFISLATASAKTSYSQNAKFTLNLERVTVKELFDKIEKSSEFIFVYYDNIIDLNKVVSVQAKDETVEEILDRVFKSSENTFKIFDRQIVIAKKESSKADIEALNAQQPQKKEISGTLKDSKGLLLPGVTVLVKGTTTGTITDAYGQFKLLVPADAKILVLSFVGMKTKELPIVSVTSFMVSMEEEIVNVEDIVVVGYGTQKKSSLTAAISSVDGKELEKIPISNLSNSLGGRLSGVLARQGNGEPGNDDTNINIRGIGTTGNSSPLLIVDGVPRDYKQLDPNTVESITVLKDAAAVAPFGVAGGNGVVLVTTKRGKTGAPSISYNGYVAVQNPVVLPDFVNGYQFALLKNAAAANENNATAPYNAEALQKFKDGSDPDRYPPYYNIFKEVITPNAPMTSHNLQISGGTDKVHYYASLGYMYQAGMWSTTNTKRYNLSSNFDAQVTNTTKVSLMLNGMLTKNMYPAIDRYVDSYDKPIPTRVFELFGYATPESGPATYSNGMWGTYIMPGLFGSGYERLNKMTIYSQFAIEQKIPFIPGLTLKGLMAYDPHIFTDKVWKTPNHLAYIVDRTQTPYVISDGIFGDPKPNLMQKDIIGDQLTYQGSLNYIHSFGKHNLSALALVESRSNDEGWTSLKRINYDVDIDEIGMGSSSAYDQSTDGSSSRARQIGLVYRLGYDYNSKYLVETSGRYDGSYYFAPGKRWGFFPSVSLGWRLSQENFIKDNYLWIDNLKLRASYGEVGALAGSPFQYLSMFGVFGPATVLGGQSLQATKENSQANPNITWERAKKTDIGIDFSLWKGLLKVEADYFYEKRSNMLINPNVTVPAEYGIGLSQVNAAIMANQGIDLAVSSFYKVSNDLQLSLSTNITYADNKLLQVFETASTYDNPNRRLTGRPLGSYFGYQAVGYFQESDFDTNGILKQGIAVQPWGKVHPGDIRYKDINTDGKINSDDYTFIGNLSPIPRIIYGITPSVKYKDFSLEILFQGAAKSNFYANGNYALPFFNGMGATRDQMDYWTPTNTDAKYPRITSYPAPNNQQRSSFWVRDISYLRMKNITFSYTVPSKIVNKLKIQNASIYIAGQNLFTFTSVKNLDPEQYNFSEASVAGGIGGWNMQSGWMYPQQKTISLGINLTL